MTLEKFSTPPLTVSGILQRIDEGHLGLPDFQRTFKWGADRIFELLCSVFRDYPAGSLLFLQAESGELFPRAFYGARRLQEDGHLTLVLDGQQRLTSLWLAVKGFRDGAGRPDPVRQSHEPVFLLDVGRLLADRESSDPDPERWLTYALPQIRGRKNPQFSHYLIRDWDEKEEGGFVWRVWDGRPSTERKLVSLIDFGKDAVLLDIERWQQARSGRPLSEVEVEFLGILRRRPENYRFPVVVLNRGYGLEKVCFIFEKVNSAGLPLSTFEFLTARLYRPERAGDPQSGFNLRNKWNDEVANRDGRRLSHLGISDLVVLQTLSLLKTCASWERSSRPDKGGPSCRRRDIFELTTDDVVQLWDGAVEAIDRCLRLLIDEGVKYQKWFAYPTALPAMATIWHRFHERLPHDQVGPRLSQVLARWYWCAVFGRRYSSLVETMLAEDVKGLIGWIEDRECRPPRWIREFEFNTSVLYEVSRQSNVFYRGAMCLLIKKGMLDFHTYNPISTEAFVKGEIDDHHIFPRAYIIDVLRQQGIAGDEAEARANSVLNRTLIDALTNRIIGADPPSRYLHRLVDSLPADVRQARVKVLGSHTIPIECDLSILRRDDFDAFLSFREQQLAKLIAEATGGRVKAGGVAAEDETGQTFPDEAAVEGQDG